MSLVSGALAEARAIAVMCPVSARCRGGRWIGPTTSGITSGCSAPTRGSLAGLPEDDRLRPAWRQPRLVAGQAAWASVPLNERISLYTLVTYMRPSAKPGPAAAMDEAWNFTVGLAFYPRGGAHTATVAGDCWSPLLPVAKNGTFLVDASQNF